MHLDDHFMIGKRLYWLWFGDMDAPFIWSAWLQCWLNMGAKYVTDDYGNLVKID